MTHDVRLYDRFWTPDEIRSGGEMLRGLHRDPTLFRVSSRSSETAPHAGPLSLKMVRRGESVYRFGKAAFAVRPGAVLVVPPASRYSTHVADAGAEIVSFYFPDAWVADAVAALTLAGSAMLDNGGAETDRRLDFQAHQRPTGPRMDAILRRLSRSANLNAPVDLTLDALEEAVRLGLEAVGATANLPASRPSVRHELFRRAARARALIEQNPEQDDSLSALARAACLSPFHFQRVFRAAFRETPAEMRRRLRIEKAQTLLAAGRAPVAEIARAVGFDSDSSFSRAFRASVGTSPRAFRTIYDPTVRTGWRGNR